MKNITQSLKLIALAAVLSIGISYVSAWTAPTVTPPNGNVAAPINIGSTAQTKTGNITANYLTASSESNAPVFKDTSDPAYFLNPNGDSVLANIYATKICFGVDCKTAWPSNGVSSLTAGSGISLSGSTGAVTVSSTGNGVVTSGGVAQLWKAVAGQTISCTVPNGDTYYAYVDASGVYYVRVTHVGGGLSPDTGYVHTSRVTNGYGNSATVSLAGLMGDGTDFYGNVGRCSTPWS